MLRWYPSVLLRVVLELTFVPVAFLSIFAVNCIVDPDTPWSVGPFQGPGTSADFWIIGAVLTLGWTALVLGWRGAGTIFKCLILTWHAGMTVALVALLVDAGDLVVEGEAIALSVSLGLLGPIVSVATLVSAVVWVVIDLRRGDRERTVSPMQRRNKVAAVVTAVTLAASVVAYRLGHAELGSIACALALLACHEVMRPVNPSEELRKALLLEGSAPQ